MTYVQFRMPVPRITPGAVTNLVGVAGLVAIIVAIGALTDWRWGLLAAGVFAVALTVIAQLGQAQSVPAGSNVTPMEPRKSRISVTAEAQMAAERARSGLSPMGGGMPRVQTDEAAAQMDAERGRTLAAR